MIKFEYQCILPRQNVNFVRETGLDFIVSSLISDKS